MEIVTAVLAFLNANQGLSILLAAVVAAGTFLQSASSTKAANQPSLSATLEQAPEAESIVLVIANTGRSPAHDVEVTFDPPLPEDEPSSTRMAHFMRLRYAKPVPTLVPGARLSNVYAGFPEGHDEHYGTPQQVTVTISFRGLGRFRRFQSVYNLDVELMRGETYSLASDSIRGLMKEYKKQLASIDRSLQAISRRP